MPRSPDRQPSRVMPRVSDGALMGWFQDAQKWEVLAASDYVQKLDGTWKRATTEGQLTRQAEKERLEAAAEHRRNGGQVASIPPAAVELPPETTEMPTLPAICWQGLFGDYRELVADTTEAPDGYHYAVFALVMGATLGRRVSVYQAVNLFPNFFVVLVGPTGMSRKDTAWSRGRGLLTALHAAEMEAEEAQFQIIPGIGSAEGLLDALGGQDKVVILNETEFLSLLGKAKQEGLSNLIPKLTGLFDCPDLETLKTRHNAVVCRRPFLSIISGTTTAWLQRALTAKDIWGGFANRFCYVVGTPKPPMAMPPPVDQRGFAALLGHINDVRMWASGEPTGEFRVSDEARTVFADYYRSFHGRCVVDNLIGALLPRMQVFAWKLALLYAAMNFEKEIQADHMEAGIAAADFFEAGAKSVFQHFIDGSSATENERKLLAFLKQADGPVPCRDLYRRLRLSARELNDIAQNLERVGLLRKLTATTATSASVECLKAL